MSFLSAREALTYAVSREMVQIYMVVLVGIILQLIGARLYMRLWPHELGELLQFVFTIVGFVATFVGTVALLFKLISDGTSHEPA